MKILMVGAGAVGQVFGYHLVRGGAQLSFFVRPKYVESLRDGVAMYPLNRRDRTTPVRFRDYDLVTDVGEVAARAYDQIWFSVSSTALRAGWLPDLATGIGDAAVVSLQPGIEDRRYILRFVRESRLVNGGIYLISYQAPLPQETRFPEPGMAYWFPPLVGSPFAGPKPLVREIVATLKRGGQPAREQQGFQDGLAFSVATSSPLLAALELSGWSFAALRDGRWLRLGLDAARQAAAVSAARLGRPAPVTGRVLTPAVVSLALRASRHLIPLDIETYLEYHFTKVGDQTRMYLRDFATWGQEAGLPVDAIQALVSELGDA